MTQAGSVKIGVLVGPFEMSRGAVGTRTGGKGSWRRKAKKAPKGGSQEGQKVWAAAQRLGCRQFGELDSASIIVKDQEDALAFTHPELAIDMRSNTYVLMGTPEKKPLVDVFTDLLGGIDLSKLKQKDGEEAAEDDLGNVDNVDFSKPEEEGEKSEEAAKTD